MLIISFPTAGFMVLANRIKFYQLVYFIGTLLLVHLSCNAEIKMATKECVKEHNNISKYIEFDANCYKEDESKSDADSSDPEEHVCFIMRRYCARRCTMSVYGKKCKVESLFTLNLEEEDDGTPVTLDCVCSYHKYKRGCLSTYQMTWEEVLDEFEAKCSKSYATVNNIKILLIGGLYGNLLMEYYYPDNPQLNQLVNGQMLEARMGHMSFLIDNHTIMTVGGYHDLKYLSTSEVFEITAEKVKLGSELNDSRSHAGYTVFEGVPVICGGNVAAGELYSSCVEYKSGVWLFLTEMPQKCGSLTMAGYEGHLYTFGGKCMANDNVDGTTTNTVRRYSRSKNQWKTMKPMIQARKCASAAVHESFLYVCGGLDGKPLSSCESYNPANNKWQPIAKMIKERYHLNLIAAGGRLFAFGGKPNDQLVEMYDLKTNKWTNMTKLIHRRYQSSAVVVP